MFLSFVQLLIKHTAPLFFSKLLFRLLVNTASLSFSKLLFLLLILYTASMSFNKLMSQEASTLKNTPRHLYFSKLLFKMFIRSRVSCTSKSCCFYTLLDMVSPSFSMQLRHFFHSVTVCSNFPAAELCAFPFIKLLFQLLSGRGGQSYFKK